MTPLEQGFYQVITRFGFMEEPDVPRALAQNVMLIAAYGTHQLQDPLAF